MGNLYFGRLRYVLAYFFLILAGNVYAELETQPAVMGNYSALVSYWTDNVGFNGNQPSPESLCSWLAPKYAGTGATNVGLIDVSNVKKTCQIQAASGTIYTTAQASAVLTCRAGDSRTGEVCTGLTCPDASWTLDGNLCKREACPPGEEMLNGQCVRDCTALQGHSLPNENYETDSNGNGQFNGCRIHCRTRFSYGINASGPYVEGGDASISNSSIYYNSTDCTYTGASAQPGDFDSNGTGENPKPEDPQRPEDCLNSGRGFVLSSSGKATCVASSEAPTGQKPTVQQEGVKESGTKGADGKPDPNAPDYKKEENKTTSNGNGEVSTEKTETQNSKDDGTGNKVCPDGYTKSADGNTCTKTTTTKQDEASFCEENPNSAICAGAPESSFGGSCETGFQCDGDAATCAIARASWEMNCSMKGGSQGLIDEENPGGTPEQLAAGEEALNKDGESDFDIGTEFAAKKQAWVNFSSGCPVGVQTFTIGRANILIDASIICDLGKFVRMLVHIVAYMGLARLFATKLV